MDIADDVGVLLDRLDILLTAGTLDLATRQAVETIITDLDDMNLRVRIAIYMILLSSDYAVRH